MQQHLALDHPRSVWQQLALDAAASALLVGLRLHLMHCGSKHSLGVLLRSGFGAACAAWLRSLLAAWLRSLGLPPVWHDAACLRPFLAESLLVANGLSLIHI